MSQKNRCVVPSLGLFVAGILLGGFSVIAVHEYWAYEAKDEMSALLKGEIFTTGLHGEEIGKLVTAGEIADGSEELIALGKHGPLVPVCFSGLFIRWYSNGNLNSIDVYSKGRLISPRIAYHSNGLLASIFLENINGGVSLRWDSSGSLLEHPTWVTPTDSSTDIAEQQKGGEVPKTPRVPPVLE